MHDGEVKRAAAFLENLQAEEKLSLDQTLTSFCLAALNFNEFLYLE